MTTSPADMASDKPNKNCEGRKSSKPLMEKRRRARINDCLTELQTILDALNPEGGGGSRQNKREKADILEQTVKLVKQLRQHSNRGNPPDHHAQVQFRAGFNECISEVSGFLATSQNSLNGDVRAGLLSHLANSLQGNKPFTDRLPPSKRRVDATTNSGSISSKPQVTTQTSNQSEAGNSARNVVQPMPAITVRSGPVHPVIGVSASVANNVPSALPGPGLTARLEISPSGGNSISTTRIVPIGIPIKVQSAGQFILLPSQMFNGSQLSAPIIPVLSHSAAGLAPSPVSSTGSSGSVVVSPVNDRQQSSSQSRGPTASQSERGPIMYASCSAAIRPPSASDNAVTSSMPYPVAFVAMSESSERQNGGQYEHLVYPSLDNLPKFYLPLPGNPPSESDPVWRPW